MIDVIGRNLHILSTEAKNRPDRRYIAKPFGNGSGDKWGVYDQREGRYLKNHEVEALSIREIRESI